MTPFDTWPRRPLRWAWGSIAAAIVLVGALEDPAHSHDALPTAAQPLGWSYPFSCCSTADCREVRSPGVVRESAEGYRIVQTGEVIPFGDKKIKDSPDGEFHWCSVQGKNDSDTICLFVPPRGF